MSNGQINEAMLPKKTARRFMSRRPIVGGNWKCNPASASKLPELVKNRGVRHLQV